MDDIESKFEDCVIALRASNHPFTKWEEEFLESVSLQVEDGKSLTEKQDETVMKILGKI